MTDDAPSRESDAFRCPRCNVWAHQTWYRLFVQEEERGDTWFEEFDDSKSRIVPSSAPWDSPPQKVDENAPPAPPPPSRGAWAAARCGRCGESSIWRDDRLVHPAGSTAPVAHQEMPDGARELYDEARDVVGISRRAGAALARASMERLLKVLDPDAGKVNLEKRIELVLPRVSSSLGDLLTVIRHAGNKSLHGAEDPDELTILVLDPGEEEVVDYMFTAINDLVDELITRPRKAAELYAKVPQGVRDRVERARAAAEEA